MFLTCTRYSVCFQTEKQQHDFNTLPRNTELQEPLKLATEKRPKFWYCGILLSLKLIILLGKNERFCKLDQTFSTSGKDFCQQLVKNLWHIICWKDQRFIIDQKKSVQLNCYRIFSSKENLWNGKLASRAFKKWVTKNNNYLKT